MVRFEVPVTVAGAQAPDEIALTHVIAAARAGRATGS